MVKLNKMRLNNIIANFNDCIEDIDFSISCLSNKEMISNKNMERLVKNSIRDGISSIFINTEDYLGSVLKKIGVGVSDKNLRDCITLTKNKNLIEPGFADCIISNIEIRDSFFHTYNQPSTEILIELYKNNREILLSQIAFMKNLSEKSSEVKQLDLFE